MRSTDGAATWQHPGAFQVLNVLAVDPIDSRTVYGGTFSFDPYFTALPNGVLKSRDGGATWVATGLPPAPGSCLSPSIPWDSRTLYAVPGESWPHFSSVPFRLSGYDEIRLRGRSDGLFKSIDGGATWSATGLVMPPVPRTSHEQLGPFSTARSAHIVIDPA